jgi:hypothetical protein
MGTSALSSEMAMERRPIAKSGLFSLVPIEEVHLQGGTFVGFVGGGGALFRSSLWFIGMWVRCASSHFPSSLTACTAPSTDKKQLDFRCTIQRLWGFQVR